MAARRSRLLDINLGVQATTAFGKLRASPITKHLETVIARELRESLRNAINQAMDNAYADGTFPQRSGRGYSMVRGRAQAFGTNFASLRGHLTAPHYLVVQDEGGIITPTKSRYLTVPVFEALRPDGTPKLFSSRSWIMLGSFVYKSKRTGQLYIARKRPDGKVSVLYLLLDSVTITKHKGWAQAAWEKELPRLSQEWFNIFVMHLDVGMIEEAYVRGGGSF